MINRKSGDLETAFLKPTTSADALRIPRSTVTVQVQALDARLGVKLLHRTTRRVTLTPDGTSYLREARRTLREVEELESGLGKAAARPRGRVRVDVSAAAGRHVIVPALPGFFARNPTSCSSSAAAIVPSIWSRKAWIA